MKAPLGQFNEIAKMFLRPTKSSLSSYDLGELRPWNKRGVILTLDALGTLFRFREPVAKQYLDVARRCGLKQAIKQVELETSFKKAFKAHNHRFPNYGKGKLANPEAWWTELVHRTFKPLVQEPLPPQLGSTLYEHFSSSDAYELFPDVKPFLKVVRDLRQQYSGPDDPVLVLGVISNSDPRVRSVLTSLGISLGDGEMWSKMTHQQVAFNSTTGRYDVVDPEAVSPGLYDKTKDFDFVITSYEAGYEKPDLKIFEYAVIVPPNIYPAVFPTRGSFGSQEEVDEDVKLLAIHVGDEYEKDITSLESHKLWRGILIDRDGKWESSHRNLNKIQGLEELGATVSVLLHQHAKR